MIAMKKYKRASVFASIIVIGLIISVAPAFAIGFDAEEVYKSVFVITTEDGLGSGFSIGENCIVTNAHVVGNSSVVNIETNKGKYYDGNVVALNVDLDLAVILVEKADFPILQVANEKNIKIGSDVYTVGSPEGLSYTITKGILSSKDRIIDDVSGQAYLQTDAAINPGNSGGPLVDDAGRVIGVNSIKYIGLEGNTQGIGFSIPISTVCDFLKECYFPLDKNGNVSEYLEMENYFSVSTEVSQPSSEKEIRDLTNRLRDSESEKASLKTIIIISIAVNVLLLIILLFTKMKKKAIQPQENPASNRTDFDIDILE
jgi:serine protease Do